MSYFEPGNRLIAALDVASREEAYALAACLGGAASWLKIGLELFMAAGPDIVRDFVARGERIMLDLKLHDIPATVGRAAEQASALGAELVTVHASGGRAMLKAAVGGARSAGGARRARILAVTVLTSLDAGDLGEIGVGAGEARVEEQVMRLAELAVSAGVDGVVASPQEVAMLRRVLPEDFLIVTPGVRPAGTSLDDQKRVMTPAAARAAGADLVVCGRPIRDAADPAAAARGIAAELA